jgi:hypothetical protein
MEELMRRHTILAAAGLAVAGCGNKYPCDLTTLDLGLTGNYDCTETSPCPATATITLSYEDPNQEPRMTLSYDFEVTDARQYDVTLSMHDGILGEKDSYTNRSVGLVMSIPTEGVVLYFPEQEVLDISVVDEPEYEACKPKDEERLLISFDRVDAEQVGGDDTGM